jgi:Zinc carboxypeptidase
MSGSSLPLKKRLVVACLFGTVLGTSILAAGPSASEIWELWKIVRISGADPYQLHHADLEDQLHVLLEKGKQQGLSLEVAGQSAEGRNLNLVQWGEGPLRILLWSQMHGDEPTATSALLDVLNFLVTRPDHQLVATLRSKLRLLVIPMLNPDGAERTRRRNAQGIDINRDALALTTPEGRVLKAVRDRFQPEIGFNLHNQNPRTSVGQTGKPVAISLLAVPFDKEGNDNPGRIRSKKICSRIYQTLGPYCYTRISRYDDAFNVRAFGDQMTAWGTPTVLIESGWPGPGGEEFLVRINFLALLSVFEGLADGTLEEANPAVYDALLQNQTGLIFDWILQGPTLLSGNGIPSFNTDVAINFSDRFDEKKQRKQLGTVAEIGDLGGFSAHRISAAGDQVLSPSDLSAGPPRGEISLGSRNLFLYRKKDPGSGLDPSNLTLIGTLRQGLLEEKEVK